MRRRYRATVRSETSKPSFKSSPWRDNPREALLAQRRRFIGIAFRMKDGQFEYLDLRPTNGRADDQGPPEFASR